MPAPQVGVDGAWACSQCQNVNFRQRTECNKCGRPNDQQQSPAHAGKGGGGGGGAPVAGSDGNWGCPNCQNVNFASRTACNRCQAPKPADQWGAQPPQYVAPPPQWGAPPPQYGAPPPQYVAPPPQYVAPPPQWGAPPPQWGGPPPQWGAPPPQWGAPPPHYVAPPTKGGGKGAPVAGVDGNWACSSCQNVNFANRTECFRCNAPKPHLAVPQLYPPPHQKGGKGGKGGAPVAGVDGCWACMSCQNVNFASRETCNRCQEAKPQGGHEAPADHWSCRLCQNVNADYEPLCVLCKYPREGDAVESLKQELAGSGRAVPQPGAYQPSGGGKGAPVAGVDGNWACAYCQNINFGSRPVCNRCQAPQGEMQAAAQHLGAVQPPPHWDSKGSSGGYAAGGKGKGGAPVAGMDGNWACPNCQNVNFAVRTVCNRCQTPQPAQGPPAKGGKGGKGGAPVAGENGNWACGKCSNVNFATREACNRCQEPKPEGVLSDFELLAQLSEPASGDFGEPAAKRGRIS